MASNMAAVSRLLDRSNSVNRRSLGSGSHGGFNVARPMFEHASVFQLLAIYLLAKRFHGAGEG
jgi:hypothetical protein